MSSEYIYDIFATTEANHDPDLMIGLAKLMVERPIPGGTSEGEICGFIGRHYEELVKAYSAHDRAVFAAAVKACEDADAAKKEAQ